MEMGGGAIQFVLETRVEVSRRGVSKSKISIDRGIAGASRGIGVKGNSTEMRGLSGTDKT